MAKSRLAIFGGDATHKTPIPFRETIGPREIEAVNNVMKSGNLSGFFGSPGDYFLGGPRVKEFEKKWGTKYGFKHCISVNSWTTGLMTAVGAIGIEPGDEVLCAPYTMVATATAILFYGGIPVFVDIEDETFNIDPKKLEQKITPRTKAIMLVHLFGHPAEMDTILAIAKKHNLKVIEDAAHAPGAKYKGKYVGALGDIGGFSFNYHKHVHAGEGGLLTTQNDDLALRCQMIRNHGENMIDAFKVQDISNVMGSNYRLTEMQAAIGTVQTDYVEDYVEQRNVRADRLSARLAQFDCFAPPIKKDGCTHSYYLYPFKYDEKVHDVPREVLVKAIAAEFPKPQSWEQLSVIDGYVPPLYWNAVYQKKIALGSKGFPWSMNPDVKYDYSRGTCPVVEDMYTKKLIYTPMMRENLDVSVIDDLGNAIEKVVTNIDQLQNVKIQDLR